MSELQWRIIRVWEEADYDTPHPAGYEEPIAYGMTADNAKEFCKALNHWERHADWHYDMQPDDDTVDVGTGGAGR